MKPATTTTIDPDSIVLTRAHMIAKDKASQWETEPRTGKVKVYVWLNDDAYTVDDGERPVFDDYDGDLDEFSAALDEYYKPVNRAYIKAHRAVVVAVAEALNLDLGKIGFSRNAGCSCSCSPGFVTEAVGQFDLYITATAAQS